VRPASKVFNWLFTMYGGRVRFTVPVLWTIGFMVTFVIGGLTGVLLAVPPIDFQVHNSLFLVGHFHNVIIAASCLARWRVTITGFPRPLASSSTKNGAGPRSGAGWSLLPRVLAALCAGPDGHDPARMQH